MVKTKTAVVTEWAKARGIPVRNVPLAPIFELWMKRVDAAIMAATGFALVSLDLPDCPYLDWYEDGVAPKTAARRAMKAANDG